MRNVRFVCYLGVALLTLFCVPNAHSVFHRFGGKPYLIFALGNYGILWWFQCGQRASIHPLFNMLQIPLNRDSKARTTQNLKA